jgi:Ca-activated chloride channel homolog
LIRARGENRTLLRPLRIAGFQDVPRCERTALRCNSRSCDLSFSLPVFLTSFFFLVLAFAISPRVGSAQQPAATSPAPLVAATEIVKVDASVLDNQGNFVGGLSQSNFHVLDDGSVQPIVVFTPVEAPAQVLVMIETSPAVYLIHDQHLVAAYALLDGLAVGDQVALVTYDQSPRLILQFTADKSAFLSALNTMQYTIGMGDLNLYDSISAVLDSLGPSAGKRALVILSTGLDSSPPARWDALVRKLRSNDVVIFPVGLGGALGGGSLKKTKKPAPSGSAADAGFEKAENALRLLAAITGGRAYFPQSENDFVPIYHEIASVLRHQYMLGIAPAHDGQFHTLTVEPLGAHGQPMNTPSKKPVVRVFAREGYWAPSP